MRRGLRVALAMGGVALGAATTLLPTASATPIHAHAVPAGYSVDPLQYDCQNDHASCGNAPGRGGIGESFAYLNGGNVALLYSENWYCDANVPSHASTGCEVGTPTSSTPSPASSGGANTSLGNTTSGDTLYIPVPLFANAPATECAAGTATVTCIDHPQTVDLSALASYLGVSDPTSLYNVPVPAHNHVIGTRNNAAPEWWHVAVVGVKDPATFASLTSVDAINAATKAGKAAGPVPTNISLFFQVLPGIVDPSVATDPAYLNADDFPPTTPAGPPPATAADQSETGTTFNDLNYDCGQSAPNCQNIGVAHGWVGGTPGASGQDVQLLYTEQAFCDASVANPGAAPCEVGKPAAKVPPGVSDTVAPTAASSAPGAAGNGQIDPLYIPVPLGFTPTYSQCPGAINCIDHPATVDLSNIAKYLPGNPSPASLTNVPLPSHDHVVRTRNGDAPEWWNVEVVPVTSQAQLTAIENAKNLSPAQELPFNPSTNPGGAIDTNVYLWFQTLPGQAVATPGPVKTGCTSTLPPGKVVGAAPLADGTGYIETDSAGDVAVFGAATCYGSLTGLKLTKPVVGITADRTTGGYWLVASDGGVFAFNAPFFGSTGNITLNKPIVGIATDLNSQGYYIVASDGGVFAYGEPFLGSTGGIKLNKPVVGMAVNPATDGYWLVASDGGVFSFGAPFEGSTGNIKLNKPIVSMHSDFDGGGYRLVASDGGVFAFGTAGFYGSTGNIKLNQPIVASGDDPGTDGYWSFAADGGVFAFNTNFFGSAARAA